MQARLQYIKNSNHRRRQEMKTKTQVIKERPEYKTLINAVINNIGMDSVEDVINHGIDGGFHGFVYHTETIAFYKKHKKIINKMALEMASELGENILEMIGGFNCLKYYDHKTGKWTESEGQDAIGKTFYGNDLDTQVANALAWFAAEEVCRMFED
jgi:hypothetical protein